MKVFPAGQVAHSPPQDYSPVYLTKNGRGRFVVMDIEDYEHDRAEKKALKVLVGDKMLKLQINPIVARDLKNIRDYIAEDNEEYAVETVKEIYRVINRYQDVTRIFD